LSIRLYLKGKLDIAKERNENNEVDIKDWEDSTIFKSPKECIRVY